MTNMKRITIAISDDIDKKVLELRRKDDRFIRASYSEIVRTLILMGVDEFESELKNLIKENST